MDCVLYMYVYSCIVHTHISGVAKGGPGRTHTHPNVSCACHSRSMCSNRRVKHSIKAVKKPGCVLPTYQVWLHHWCIHKRSIYLTGNHHMRVSIIQRLSRVWRGFKWDHLVVHIQFVQKKSPVTLWLLTTPHPPTLYCIAQNFGSKKYWRIWWMNLYLPMFFLPIILTTKIWRYSSRNVP